MPAAAAECVEAACGARQCERAIDLMESAARVWPSDPNLHLQLGVCYSGGCRVHSLVSAEMAATYLRRCLRLLRPEAVDARAVALDTLGSTLSRCRESPREAALREAVHCHQEAAELCASSEKWDDWARAQFNLANCCCDLAEATGENLWPEAVAHYREALRIRTREANPERYAAMLENMGTALRRFSPAEAIGCYRRALRVYTSLAYPERNAALQNNLGNVFLSLPEIDEKTTARNARRALGHFDRALRVCRQCAAGSTYGITQYNRAQAYWRLANLSPVVSLTMAFDCLEEAHAAFRACGESRYLDLVRSQMEKIRAHYHGS